MPRAVTNSDLWGYRPFDWTFRALTAIRSKGLLRAMSFFASSQLLVAVMFVWKVRRFAHWRLSRRISEEAYGVRDAVCRGCPKQIVLEDGRYDNHPSRYCALCGCSNSKRAELCVKNRRRGHICPRLRFPEQAERKKKMEQAEKAAATKPKCATCNGNGNGNGRGHKLADWQRNSGLLYARPSIGE